MSGTRRGAPVVFAALGLLGAVAVAAGAGASGGGGEGARRPSDWVLDVIVSLVLVQLVVGGVLLAVLLVLRPQELVDPRQDGKATGGRKALVGVAIVVVLFAVLAIRRILTGDGSSLARLLGHSPTGAPATSVTDRYEPQFATWPVAAITGLLLIALCAWLLAARARRKALPGEQDLQAALEAALDDSLDDLRAEPDPRRAVIAAYARLELVLAAHDVPRRASEAPGEYLRRVLAALDVSPAAVSRLTSLFQTAKFSHHDVDDTMKNDAIDALTATRDELRALREQAETERRAAIERAGAGQGA